MQRMFHYALIAIAAAPVPAQAGIVCHGSYQVVAGSEISTPYCRDRRLAEVARASGFKVSDSEIRNDVWKKRQICRYIGSNIEVQSACAEVEGGGRGHR